MANINITGQGTFAANDFQVPNPTVAVSQVTFHSASQSCQVCFGNDATFGMSSYTVQTGSPQALTLEAVQGTSFTVIPTDQQCGQGIRDTNYNITMGSGMGGSKKPRPARKAAPKKKAAKKSSGRKKAKGKKKTAAKKKAGGKKKTARKRK